MIAECISVSELQEEIAAMLSVCFEGKIASKGDRLELTLPNGQLFNVLVQER